MKKINKLVYSLWTKPTGNLMENGGNWKNPFHNLACSMLSVLESHQWFSETEMITDIHGKTILEKLELPFTNISTALEGVNESGGFWSLGKIFAFQQQEEPFIHLDLDAILFKPLSEKFLSASLFTQNREGGNWYNQVYKELVDKGEKMFPVLPPNWNITKNAFCTGIIGATDIDFIQNYCRLSIDFIQNEKNKPVWDNIEDKWQWCVVFEQYILACLADNQKIPYTFLSESCDNKRLTNMGYTHIWGAKRDKETLSRILYTLEVKYPHHYNRLIDVWKESPYYQPIADVV